MNAQKRGRKSKPPENKKVKVTMGLDPDIVQWLRNQKEEGWGGYNRLVNAFLRERMQEDSKWDAWKTLEDVRPYLDKVERLIELGRYLEASEELNRGRHEEDDLSVLSFLLFNNHQDRVIAIIERLITAWEEPGSRREEKVNFSGMLCHLADAYRLCGNYEASKRCYLRSISTGEKVLRDLPAYCLIGLGEVHFCLKEYDKSLDYTLQGLEIARPLELTRAAFRALNNLANIYAQTGVKEAETKCRRELKRSARSHRNTRDYFLAKHFFISLEM